MAVIEVATRRRRLHPTLEALGVLEAAWLPDSRRALLWDPQSRALVLWDTATDDLEHLPGFPTPGSPMLSPDARTLYYLEEQVDGDIWMLTLGEDG